jgi:hypothetical protein
MKLGIYRHWKTNNLYRVVSIGRSVTNPGQRLVIYKQLYDSKLRDTNIELPHGSVWVRDLNDFTPKFTFIEE